MWKKLHGGRKNCLLCADEKQTFYLACVPCQFRHFGQFVPVLPIVSIVSIVPIDGVFLDLRAKMVDPNMTAEFQYAQYVQPNQKKIKKKIKQFQTFDLAENSKNLYL